MKNKMLLGLVLMVSGVVQASSMDKGPTKTHSTANGVVKITAEGLASQVATLTSEVELLNSIMLEVLHKLATVDASSKPFIADFVNLRDHFITKD